VFCFPKSRINENGGKKTALADKLFCRFRFVAAYIDVLVVIKLSNGYSYDDSSRSYEIVMGS